MRYEGINFASMADGPGFRVSLFVTGCTHHCKGCFNPETWDFSAGHEYTEAIEEEILFVLSRPHISGLTILGGEPMELINQKGIVHLVKKTKELGKSVWIYSGYLFEDLLNNPRCHGPYTEEILKHTDFLVDGEFHIDEKDLTLRFRGSRNQRIIDVQKSLAEGRTIEEIEDEEE